MTSEEQMNHANEFGEKITSLVDEYKDRVPLTSMAKIFASLQVDIMALHSAIQAMATVREHEAPTPSPIEDIITP